MRNIERSGERGTSDLGWLLSRFTYSFAEYMNPNRMGFGALRVVNDDTIAPRSGFPLHRHEQMEIVTIMLEGTLTHHDTLGNTKDLSAGEVQTMTASTGVSHGEWNNDESVPVKLLQVWIIPKERALVPRYTQQRFDAGGRMNNFQILACGVKKDDALFIHQDAVFARAFIEHGKSLTYALSDATHGVFVFVISGSLTLGADILEPRDSMEISEEPEIVFAAANGPVDVLAIEVPLR